MSTTHFRRQRGAQALFLAPGRFTFLDAPGGSQVPDEVGDAMAAALREASGNLGAPYATGERVEAILYQARADAGRFLNCSADDVIFGGNMTTLDFALSRTASRDWREGDKILVSRLDHDGGVAPWVELAADRGFELDWIDVTEDLRLDLDDLERKLDDRVRVVAFVFASNAVGSITDAKRVSELARNAGALSWIDAVHYAAHEPIDVEDIGCDVLLCSPYKFCGPHMGLAYGRHELLESWRPYKARPARRARSAGVRDRNGAVRAPGRLLGDDRVPRLARRLEPLRTTSASSASASSTGCPPASPSTASRRWRAASRRSC